MKGGREWKKRLECIIKYPTQEKPTKLENSYFFFRVSLLLVVYKLISNLCIRLSKCM